MYIAGRLRTASMPPKTLMDVASYLCPAPLPPADSFSAMSRASPQTARSYDCKNFKRLVVHGKAVARTARHLPCPLASASGNSGLDICPRHVCACETRRVAASSRPVPKFPGRRGEAFIFLSEEESSEAGLPFLPWREFGSDSAVQEESRTTKFYRKTGIFTR